MRPTLPFIIRILLGVFSLGILSACSEDKPPEYVDPPPFFDGKDGSRCISQSDCLGGVCISELSGWREGYCTTPGCNMRECNNEDAVCVTLLGAPSCFDGCESDDDCRAGYECAEKDGLKFCSARFEDGPVRGETGSSCESDDDCHRDLECETSLPGGYCLSRDCVTCVGDGACVQFRDVGKACMDGCEFTSECRNGYLCRPFEASTICQPSNDPAPAVPFERTVELLDIQCGGTPLGEGPTGFRWEVEFDVPAGIDSYVVVPLVETGLISPLTITGPGEDIDLIDTYRHHNLRALEVNLYDAEPVGRHAAFSFDWAIQVPYAPQFANLMVPGRHALRLTTTDSEPCIYVIGGNAGQTLDLNVYLVGIQGLDAATAADNADLAEVMETVNRIYSQAGISLGNVRYYDPTEEATERYAVLRSLADTKRLSAMGEAHEATLDGHLSVDVFLVEDILINAGGGAIKILGLSAGLPGAPGMHGNPGNGLVFGVTDLGFDNAFVGFIMAHEIGHYLGLRHTTETVFGSGSAQEVQFELVGATDPILDTPVCDDIFTTMPSTCPDFNNLLFPAAPPKGSEIMPALTDGQGEVMRINPLVR